MEWLMILTVIFGGEISTATASFRDIDACNAAGRAYMERAVGRLEIIWECVPTKSQTVS